MIVILSRPPNPCLYTPCCHRSRVVTWLKASAWACRSGSIQAAVTPGKGRRSARASSGLACAEVLQESGDGMSGLSQNTQVLADVDDPGIPAVPKRMRTGVLRGMLWLCIRNCQLALHAHELESYQAAAFASKRLMTTARTLVKEGCQLARHHDPGHQGVGMH